MLPRLQNKFIENSNTGRKFLETFNICLPFPENCFYIRQPNLAFKALNQYSVAKKIRFRLFADFKKNSQETQIQGESFWRASTFASRSKKNGFIFVNKVWHFKALNQYSVAHKIRFRLLKDFEINLQETQIQEESFQKVSMFASLSQKNGFVFAKQSWHFKALTQYSVAKKIRFSLLKNFQTNLQETQIQGESF